MIKYIFLLFFLPFALCNKWNNIGVAESDSYIKYTIALKQTNLDFLESLALNISNPKHNDYGKYLTKEEINYYSKPEEKITNKVLFWLTNNNVHKFKFFGDSIQCIDKVYNIEKMFNVRMFKFKNLKTKKFVIKANNNYVIPKSLHNYIIFIDGLSNPLFPVYDPVISSNNPDSGIIGREVIDRLYDINPKTVIENKTISAAAVEFQGGGFSKDDLKNTQINNGVKPREVYKVIGGNLGGGTESKLDMQMIATTAPGVQLWYVNYNLWLYQMANDMFNREEVPDILSISYGWAERDQCSVTDCKNKSSANYVDRVNIEFMKLALRGITLVVASGDAGSPGRTNEGCDTTVDLINPVLPGSSPWILSVGATFVKQSNDTYDFKTPICKENKCASGMKTQSINFNETGWTTGSGFGIYITEKRPRWQKKLVNEYLMSGTYLPNKQNWNINGRGYPDVSVVGHNCPVLDEGNYESVDGTSCSAPVMAGIIAILNDHQVSKGRPKLGFVNQLFYQMANTKNIFNKPVVTNTHCTEYLCCSNEFGFEGASTLWDPVGGLGGPNVTSMISYLDDLFKKLKLKVPEH